MATGTIVRRHETSLDSAISLDLEEQTRLLQAILAMLTRISMNDKRCGALDRADALATALRSIAANTCCDRCHEAALVAQKALDATREGR